MKPRLLLLSAALLTAAGQLAPAAKPSMPLDGTGLSSAEQINFRNQTGVTDAIDAAINNFASSPTDNAPDFDAFNWLEAIGAQPASANLSALDIATTLYGRSLLGAVDAPAGKTILGIDKVDNTSDAENAARALANRSRFRSLASKALAIRSGTVTQLRIVVIGDSVGWGTPQWLIPPLKAALGDAGTFDFNGANFVVDGTIAKISSYPSGSVTSPAFDFSISPTGVYAQTGNTNGTITSGGANGYRCDRIKIYYIREPGAGHFKVQTSVGGGSFTDESGYTDVDASNGSKALGIITLTKTIGAYRARIVGVSGNVRALPIRQYSVGEAGVELMRLDTGSISMAEWLTCGSIVTALLNDFSPDVASVEFKDSAAIFTANLPALESTIKTANPNADVIYIGTTPVQDSAANTKRSRRMR